MARGVWRMLNEQEGPMCGRVTLGSGECRCWARIFGSTPALLPVVFGFTYVLYGFYLCKMTWTLILHHKKRALCGQDGAEKPGGQKVLWRVPSIWEVEEWLGGRWILKSTGWWGRWINPRPVGYLRTLPAVGAGWGGGLHVAYKTVGYQFPIRKRHLIPPNINFLNVHFEILSEGHWWRHRPGLTLDFWLSHRWLRRAKWPYQIEKPDQIENKRRGSCPYRDASSSLLNLWQPLQGHPRSRG